mgnify:CR=1 FL=1
MKPDILTEIVKILEFSFVSNFSQNVRIRMFETQFLVLHSLIFNTLAFKIIPKVNF